MPPLTESVIAARLERIPVARWHVRIAASLGIATFFDGFDALTIAFVMPSLIREWSLGPIEAGALIGIGYVGQAIGSLFFGWLAGRIGRINAIRIAVALIGVFSLACAGAQSYDQLAVVRLLQGVGLGGEVPVAAVYISEIVRANQRGRLFFLYQASFGIGIVVAGAVAAFLVPHAGWQSMFLIGAVPGLLALVLGRLCPESPRWLASRGRLREAGLIVDRIERAVFRDGAVPAIDVPEADAPPTPGRWAELWSTRYWKRTLATAGLWIAANACLYGLGTWMPTLLTQYYAVPLQKALDFSLAINVTGLGSLLILAFSAERISRRTLLAACLTVGAAAQLALWVEHGGSLMLLVSLAGLSMLFFNVVAASLYLYTGELYPTRLRALGTGFGSFCLRITAVGTPFMVGSVLREYGPVGVFVSFGLLSSAGALLAWTTAHDTRGRWTDCGQTH